MVLFLYVITSCMTAWENIPNKLGVDKEILGVYTKAVLQLKKNNHSFMILIHSYRETIDGYKNDHQKHINCL